MGRQTDRVTDMQRRVQLVFDTYPFVPLMMIEEIVGIPPGHLHKWIARGKVTKPDNLAVGFGYRYAGEVIRETPGKEGNGAGGVVAPSSGVPVVASKPTSGCKDTPTHEKTQTFVDDDEEPVPSIEQLRTMTKRAMRGAIHNARDLASYSTALNNLMGIQSKETTVDKEEEELLHIYAPQESIGPSDE